MFQLVPSQLIVTIVAEVHAATLCPLATSNEIWSYVLNSYNFLSTGTAGTAAWFYYLRFRPQLKPKKSMTKFNVFSGIVALQITQQYIFSEIADQKAYWPTNHVSFRDFAIGLPAFILCWECYWFSILFLYAFHFRDYRMMILRGEATAGSLSGAFVEIIDLRDILRGVLLMFTMREPGRPRVLQKEDPSTSQELPLTEYPGPQARAS